MGDEVQQIVIAGLDPPAGPKPLRRGEGPAIHRAKRISALMDARVRPAHDDLRMGQPL
jgi:peptide/nickel transport system ATP-binding protein